MLWLHGVRIVLQVRLLHRNVGIRIGGASEVAVFGSIDHPAGNISVELLKNGFGRMVDWSLCTFHTSVLFVYVYVCVVMGVCARVYVCGGACPQFSSVLAAQSPPPSLSCRTCSVRDSR